MLLNPISQISIKNVLKSKEQLLKTQPQLIFLKNNSDFICQTLTQKLHWAFLWLLKFQWYFFRIENFYKCSKRLLGSGWPCTSFLSILASRKNDGAWNPRQSLKHVSLIFSMKKILGGPHNMFSPWPASYQIPFKIIFS